MRMNMKEEQQIAIRVPELRKKELRSKLTYAEQQELDKMLSIKAESYPDSTKEQYAENVRFTAIKNMTIKEVERKESIFQRFFKAEKWTVYKIHLLNEEEDVAEYTIHFTFALEIRQLMEELGLLQDWPKMLPVEFSMSYTDPLDKEDKEWFESFPAPTWCSSKLQGVRNLEKVAASRGEEMVRAIQWFKTHWENGYQIYADIDPFEEDEWE